MEGLRPSRPNAVSDRHWLGSHLTPLSFPHRHLSHRHHQDPAAAAAGRARAAVSGDAARLEPHLQAGRLSRLVRWVCILTLDLWCPWLTLRLSTGWRRRCCGRPRTAPSSSARTTGCRVHSGAPAPVLHSTSPVPWPPPCWPLPSPIPRTSLKCGCRRAPPGARWSLILLMSGTSKVSGGCGGGLVLRLRGQLSLRLWSYQSMTGSSIDLGNGWEILLLIILGMFINSGDLK